MLTGHTRLCVAIKSKCKWRKEFVAVERIELSCFAASGLKPDVSTNFTTRHPYIFYYQKHRPYAEPISAYDSWLFAQRAYSEPLLRLLVLLISAFLRLIRLSLSPTFPSDLHCYLPALLLRVGANSWPMLGSEFTSFLPAVLTG